MFCEKIKRNITALYNHDLTKFQICQFSEAH